MARKERNIDGTFAEGNNIAAVNNQYKEEYCDKVDEYLKDQVDKEVKIVKQENEEKGYKMYAGKLKVQLPTLEGFARFIDVSHKTLLKWERNNIPFGKALSKIRTEQKGRLINMGLSGDYNSTIAKLILSANHGMREGTDITSDNKPIAILGNALPDNHSGQQDNKAQEEN